LKLKQKNRDKNFQKQIPWQEVGFASHWKCLSDKERSIAAKMHCSFWNICLKNRYASKKKKNYNILFNNSFAYETDNDTWITEFIQQETLSTLRKLQI